MITPTTAMIRKMISYIFAPGIDSCIAYRHILRAGEGNVQLYSATPHCSLRQGMASTGTSRLRPVFPECLSLQQAERDFIGKER